MTNSEMIDFAYFCDVIEDNYLVNMDAPDLHSVYHSILDEINEVLEDEFDNPHIDKESEIVDFINDSSYYGTHFTTEDDNHNIISDSLQSYYDNNINNNEDEGIELEPEDYEELRQRWIDMTWEEVIDPYLESHNGWIPEIFGNNNIVPIMEVYA